MTRVVRKATAKKATKATKASTSTLPPLRPPPRKHAPKVAPAPDAEVPEGLLTQEERAQAKRTAQLALFELVEYRRSKTEAEKAAKVIQAEIIKNMRRAGVTRIEVKTTGGQSISGTLVAGTNTTVDPVRLKRKVGATIWNKIVTKVLDKNKLDAFVASGEISPQAVAACSIETDRTPFIDTTVR